MTIGEYIKEKTGLSQRALAAELGINHNAIQRRFSGAGTMDVQTLVMIADRYNLDLLELMVHSNLISAQRAESLRGTSLQDASNEDLTAELLRRLNTSDSAAMPIQQAHSYSADDYALAAKRGAVHSSEEGFFDA